MKRPKMEVADWVPNTVWASLFCGIGTVDLMQGDWVFVLVEYVVGGFFLKWALEDWEKR